MTEDQFWQEVENDLLKKVDLTREKNRTIYTNELMSRIKFLSLRLKDEKDQQRQLNLQEAIEVFLSVYLYVTTLDKYIKAQSINKIIISLENSMNNMQNIEKLKTLQKESDKASAELSKLYSKEAIADLIKITLAPFPFIYNSLNESQINTMAQALLTFVSTEMIQAKKTFKKPFENTAVYRYIQLAPLISDEYARRKGRFYLKALVEELAVTQELLKASKESYAALYNELFKKLITHSYNDLMVLTQLL
jgi:type I site-specific restriction endonuclease